MGYVEEMFEFEPSESYASLRSCPVRHVTEHDPPFFVVSRYDDVAEMLRNNTQWRNGFGPGVFFQEGGVLGSSDEPDHSRQRRTLRAHFVPTSVAAYEPRLRELADDLLDDFVPLGRGDFIDAFAFPFPALAAGELLGVRAEDRAMFAELSSTIVAALTGGDIPAYRSATGRLGDYIEERLADREALAADDRPDDVLTALLDARAAGKLSTAEVRHLGHQLLVAGHETTTSLIGLLMYRLLERPSVIAALRADESLIPAAIEEGLRFDSPVSGLFRTGAAPSELHGVEIPEKTKVQVLYAAANRDPARFECPDEFRLDRPSSESGHHLAFGWGIHYCIGAPFARLEARIAIEHVLRRMHDISLDGTAVRNESFVLHGLTSLPIRWTPA